MITSTTHADAKRQLLWSLSAQHGVARENFNYFSIPIITAIALVRQMKYCWFYYKTSLEPMGGGSSPKSCELVHQDMVDLDVPDALAHAVHEGLLDILMYMDKEKADRKDNSYHYKASLGWWLEAGIRGQTCDCFLDAVDGTVRFQIGYALRTELHLEFRPTKKIGAWQ